jgi:hypothetical protein
VERDAKKSDIARIDRSEAYAAVAPKISTLLAVVKRPRQIEKIAEYATMTPSRSIMDWTKYNVKIEAAGMQLANKIPMRCEMPLIWVFR